MDSIFDSLQSPDSGQSPPDQTDVDALTARATQMANEGGPGAHAAEAEAWLKSQMQQAGAQPTTSIFDSYSGDGSLPAPKETKPSKSQSIFSQVGETPSKPTGRADSTQSYIDAAKQLAAGTVQAGGEYAEHATDAIANAFGQAASYIKNFGKEHETFDAGMVTPQERAAAKLMGISDIGLTHGSVYKMTPEQRQALDDQTMKAWGLTPEQERARVEANMAGDLSSPDVVGGTLSQSLMANLAEKAANPRMADTRKYYEIQDTVRAMDITAHPDQHAPDEVKAAATRIQSLKDKLSPNTWDQVKDMWKQAVAEPGKTAKSLGYGFLIDPELALAPEAKLGTLTYGAKEAAALRAAQTGRDLQKTARAVESAATGTSTAATAASEAAQRSGDVYGRVAARAEQAAAGAKQGRSIFDTLSSVGSGAGINAGIAASQQETEQGYVREGSLGAPVIAGGVIGGVGHAVAGALTRLHPDTTTTAPAAGSPDATGKIKEPGAPLPPETPVSKEGTVPYYGGVSADGKIIHLDENTPNHVPVTNRDGASVNVPAKETVAYHESVEYPLMHLEGPVNPAQIQLIKDRMGPHVYFEPGVEEKLLKGESLTYSEAHDVATRSENHLVESLYNVDSKKYQEALKPYIKKVGEASKSATASDIPIDLDTKPYDNMGYPEQLKGAGARPDIDQGQRGAADKRLIATGAVAGTGAAIGAAAAGPDNRTAGAVAGGLAGLALSSLHWGSDIGAAGLGKKEAGMFAGPTARTWSPTEERVATSMERLGKSPEDIHRITGMSRDAEGKWTKEIDDSKMHVLPLDHPNWERAKKEPIPLSTLVDHPELDKAYPGLLDKVKIFINPNMEPVGSFLRDQNTLVLKDPKYLEQLAQKRPTMAPKSVIAHELQHSLQETEGRQLGTNVGYETKRLTDVRGYLEGRQEDLYQKWREASMTGDDAKTAALDKQLRKVSDQIDRLPEKAKWNYVANAGETEARNVQARLGLSPEERAAKLPSKTEDVPRANQRVNKESGQIDPELLKKMAKVTGLTLLGGTLGAASNKDNPLGGASLGALAALGGAEVFRRAFPDFKMSDTVRRREGVTSNKLFNTQEGSIKVGERYTYQKIKQVQNLAKKGADRDAITHAIQSDNVKSLAPNVRAAAKIAQDNFESVGQQAIKSGVLNGLLEHYVTNLWKDTPKRAEILAQVRDQTSSPMSTTSRFALQRYIPSIAEGKRLGLEPVTEDISEILGIYNNSMIRAMANDQLMKGLRQTPLDTKGNMMIMPKSRAPAGYLPMNHPQLEGWRVAPDIVPSMKYIFNTFDNNAILSKLQGLNALAKRGTFALSMFHPMSLLQAHILANPLWQAPKGVLDFAKSLAGKSEAHEKYLNGMQGDDIDGLLRNGLMVSPPGQSLEKLNMQHDISNQVLTQVQDFMNKVAPYTGTLSAGLVKKALDFNDYVVWHGAHFGMKTMTALQAYDRLKTNWAKVLEKDPSAKVPPQDELYRQAAQFANDAFGGLNLRRLADDATTELGRNLALHSTTPKAQRVAQLLLMAPDWKMSTIRTFLKSAGVPRLSTSDATALYQRYVLRGAILYFTLFNALNNQLSGHNIWENKDPLMLDNGDGTKTQLSKHFMEFPELTHDPKKFILNSASPIVHELFEQLLNKEYLTTSGGPPMKSNPWGHAAKTFLPITASPDMTPAQRLSGFVGFPQSGITNEQKAKNKEAAKQRAAEKRMNKLMSGGQ
jgi:hypothetical protein